MGACRLSRLGGALFVSCEESGAVELDGEGMVCAVARGD